MLPLLLISFLSRPASSHVHFSNPTYSTNQASCCKILHEELGPQISFPNTSTYNTSLQSYWSDLETDLQPTCILHPLEDQDVAHAVKILISNPHCKLAVRGGGHTGWCGAANIQDGVTIDLRSLNKVSLSNDSGVVTIQGGALWNEVYEYLDARSLNVAGGRVATVGVGGLTLGGGVSFFSPRIGFVCDTVVSFDLVNAKGELETISASNKPDLFRALKGGGNSFGIVTAFKLRTIPGGDFWHGSVTHDQADADALVDAFKAVSMSEEYDPYAAYLQHHLWLNSGLGGAKIVYSLLAYTKVPAQNTTPEFLKPLINAAPPLNTNLKTRPLSTFLASETIGDPRTPRQVLETMSFRLSSNNFLNRLRNLFELTASKIDTTVPLPGLMAFFQPLPQIITSRSNATGGNVLGFTPEDATVINVCLYSMWSGAEYDDVVEGIVREAIEEGKELAEEMGVHTRQLYANYAQKWQDPFSGYGEEYVEFLRQVSRKYDRKGVWQSQMPGGFKLWSGNGTG